MNGDMVELVLTVLVAAAAAYRITRLVVLDDVIGEWPSEDHPRGTFARKAIDVVLYDDTGLARHPVTDYVGKLYSCTFCTGWWVSLAVLSVWWRVWPWQLGVEGWVGVFAVAGVQGFISSRHNA